MAPLQKKVYRSILSKSTTIFSSFSPILTLCLGHNLDLLRGLTQPNKNSSVTKGKLNNILMHLRKLVFLNSCSVARFCWLVFQDVSNTLTSTLKTLSLEVYHKVKSTWSSSTRAPSCDCSRCYSPSSKPVDIVFFCSVRWTPTLMLISCYWWSLFDSLFLH